MMRKCGRVVAFWSSMDVVASLRFDATRGGDHWKYRASTGRRISQAEVATVSAPSEGE